MKDYYISSAKYNIQTRQTKKNGVVYDVVFRVLTRDGIEKQKRLSGFKTKTAAKEAYTAFTTENCEFVKNNPLKKRENTEKTLGEYAAEWFTVMRTQLKDATLYAIKSEFDLYVFPYFRDTPMTEITKPVLAEWQDKIWTAVNPKTGKPYSYATCEHRRAYFQSFLTWYCQRVEQPNPFSFIKRPKKRVPTKEMSIWTREQFDAFVSTVHGQPYRTIFAVLFFTGRRKGEVLALRKEDVKQGKIRFAFSLTTKGKDEGKTYKITTTKTEKPDYTPICPALQAFLDDYVPPEEGDFFFGGKDPVHPNTLSHRFEAYLKETGAKRIRIHDLRHSFVSMIIHGGASIPVVANLIGDTQQQVMKTYSHFYVEDREAVLRQIT